MRPGLRCQKGWRFPIRSRLDCAHRRREACGACRTRPTDRPFGQRRRRWWTLIIVAPTTLVQSIERGNGVASSAPVHFLLKQFRTVLSQPVVKRRTSTSLASEACVRDFYRTVHVSETGHVEPFLAIKFQVHLTGHCRLSSTDQPVTKFFSFSAATIIHQQPSCIKKYVARRHRFHLSRARPERRFRGRGYSSAFTRRSAPPSSARPTSCSEQASSLKNEAGTKKRIRDLSRGPCTVAPIHTFTHRHHDCAEYLAT